MSELRVRNCYLNREIGNYNGYFVDECYEDKNRKRETKFFRILKHGQGHKYFLSLIEGIKSFNNKLTDIEVDNIIKGIFSSTEP